MSSIIQNNETLSEIYKSLETEVNQIESIENWNDRIIKMKDIRKKIILEQQKLETITSSILKINEQIQPVSKKNKNQNLDNLINSFEVAETLEDKIKLYNNINSHINNIETQLFSFE
jgi:hypothetical protein